MFFFFFHAPLQPIHELRRIHPEGAENMNSTDSTQSTLSTSHTPQLRESSCGGAKRIQKMRTLKKWVWHSVNEANCRWFLSMYELYFLNFRTRRTRLQNIVLWHPKLHIPRVYLFTWPKYQSKVKAIPETLPKWNTRRRTHDRACPLILPKFRHNHVLKRWALLRVKFFS